MDIPALSMALAQTNLQSDIGIAMLGKALDVSRDLGDGLADMLEQSVTPYLGGSIDISL